MRENRDLFRELVRNKTWEVSGLLAVFQYINVDLITTLIRIRLAIRAKVSRV